MLKTIITNLKEEATQFRYGNKIELTPLIEKLEMAQIHIETLTKINTQSPNKKYLCIVCGGKGTYYVEGGEDGYDQLCTNCKGTGKL